jgi:hypothetical protein
MELKSEVEARCRLLNRGLSGVGSKNVEDEIDEKDELWERVDIVLSELDERK